MNGDQAACQCPGPVIRPRTQPATTTGSGSAPRTVDSQTLLQGHSSLLIRHQGEVYRLQLTRQGKLILTK